MIFLHVCSLVFSCRQCTAQVANFSGYENVLKRRLELRITHLYAENISSKLLTGHGFRMELILLTRK